MSKEHLMWLGIALAAYFVGAKWPVLAQKTGLA